jgi:transcription elongation factor Elf1
MKNKYYEKLIKLVPQILLNKNSKIRCPKCEKSDLKFYDIDLGTHFVRAIKCESCGLYEEILKSKEFM